MFWASAEFTNVLPTLFLVTSRPIEGVGIEPVLNPTTQPPITVFYVTNFHILHPTTLLASPSPPPSPPALFTRW